jgi:protein arginine kinase
MNLRDLSEHPGQWLSGAGPHGEVVISSRVRLARNVAGFPFLSKASGMQRRELLDTCRQNILDSRFGDRVLWVDLDDSPKLDRQLLVERHLISRQHANGEAARGVAVSLDETFGIMVNEEDHLRIQVLRSGMQLDDVYAQASQIDDVLESRLSYAYSQRFGYLTACPTNVGTGIRVSVMLHLPALKMTGDIEKVRRAAKDMHLAVRGFHGEGTEAIGDFYQVSNQVTLGRSEQDILADFQHEIIPQVIEYEHRARKALLDHRQTLLDDRVHRAWGLLTSARMLGSEEALYLLSHLRLGVALGRITGVGISTINELFVLTQPAHLQRITKQPLSGAERRQVRADFVRQRLAQPQGG